MPRKALDYSRIIIYKIVCNDINVKDCYVGSTTDFSKRKYCHKSACNKPNGSHCKVYELIRDNGGWDNWSMVLIETYPCDNKLEAEKRERFWFEELHSRLNTYRPHSTKEEKQTYNKDYCYEYRKNNRQKLLNEKKEYWKNNKDEIIKKQTAYRELNRTKINNQKKEHYEKNKDEINRLRRENYKNK